MSLPLRAHAYLWFVVAAAAGLLAYWVRAWRGRVPLGAHDAAVVVLLVALAATAVTFPLEVLPKHKVNTAAAVYFAGLLLFGVPTAMVVAALGQLLGGAALAGRRFRDLRTRLRSLRGVLFNASQVSLAVGLAGLVYYALLPHQAPAPLERAENLWALPGAAAAMFLANTLAVAVMVGLQRGENPVAVWLAGRRVDALQFAALFPIGLVTALATAHYPWAPVAMVLPAAAVYLSLKRTVELAERARAEAEAQRRLARQRDELTRSEAREAALREQDQLKDELLATIAHELRTPLTVIQGYAERLQAQAASPGALDRAAYERAAAAIHSASQRLARLAQDLSEFGRAERHEVTVEAVDFDVAPVLHQLLGGLTRQRGGARVVWELPARLPVHADRARVEQMVSNLVENALKYAPSGAVVVRAAPAAAARRVRVEVEDRGPGVPTEEQQRVWEKFYRGARVAHVSPSGGSGIGLAVVKALAEAHGGAVGVESTGGHGARFWFEVPAPAEPLAPPTPAPTAPPVPDTPPPTIAGVTASTVTAPSGAGAPRSDPPPSTRPPPQRA